MYNVDTGFERAGAPGALPQSEKKRKPGNYFSGLNPFTGCAIHTPKALVLSGNSGTRFKFFVAIFQRGYVRCGMIMPKRRGTRNVACHPAKRVKITARRHGVKNKLICNLASRKEFPEAVDVFFVRTDRLRL